MRSLHRTLSASAHTYCTIFDSDKLVFWFLSVENSAFYQEYKSLEMRAVFTLVNASPDVLGNQGAKKYVTGNLIMLMEYTALPLKIHNQ